MRGGNVRTGRGDRGSTVFELAVVLQYRYFVGSLIPFQGICAGLHYPCLYQILFLEKFGRGGLSFECSEVCEDFFSFLFLCHNWAMVLRLWQMLELEEKGSGK